MKKNNLIVLITTIICLLPILIGIILYDRLPEQMAIHFNINNEPTRCLSKNFVLFINPAIMATLHLIICFILNRSYKKDIPKFIQLIPFFIPTIVTLIYYIIFMFNLNETINIGRTVCLVLGALFCLIGNYIPKISYEYNGEMNLPKVKDEKSFKKMMKKVGYFLIGIGIILLTVSFLV